MEKALSDNEVCETTKLPRTLDRSRVSSQRRRALVTYSGDNMDNANLGRYSFRDAISFHQYCASFIFSLHTGKICAITAAGSLK